MPTAKKIDRATLRLISEDALKALQEVADKYGITLSQGRSTYSNGDTGTLKFEMVLRTQDADGNVLSRQALDFQKHASLYGLDPSDLGREFDSNGKKYRITGLAGGRSTYPILAENLSNGKTYKFAADIIQFKLGRHRLQRTPASA